MLAILEVNKGVITCCPRGRQSPRDCPLAAKGAATDEVEVGLEKARHFFQTFKSVSNVPNLSLGSEADQVSRKNLTSGKCAFEDGSRS